jgi:predicted nucleic acid-binding protein
MIVSDSSPIVAFIQKNEFRLLNALFSTIHLPFTVHAELVEGSGVDMVQVQEIEEAVTAGWIVVEPLLEESRMTNFHLGKGETEAITVCLAEPGPHLLLIDERKGRRVAKDHGIDILGTLGIIKLAITRNLLDESKALDNLEHLLTAGFFLSSDVVRRFMVSLDRFSGKL